MTNSSRAYQSDQSSWLRAVYLFRVMFILVLGGCGGKQDNAQVAYALAGPPLFVVGELQNQPVTGLIDREVMVGIGHVELEIAAAYGVMCSGDIHSAPSGKGRIRGVLPCSDGGQFIFVLRMLGPDQGVGLGKLDGSDDIAVFFFHPSQEEAKRRLPEVKEDISRVSNETS